MHAITNQHKGIPCRNHYGATAKWKIHPILHMTNYFFIIDYPQATAAARSCSLDTPKLTHTYTHCPCILLVPWLVSMKCLRPSLLCVSHWFTEWIERHFHGLLPHGSFLCRGIDRLFIQRPCSRIQIEKTTLQNSLETGLDDMLALVRYSKVCGLLFTYCILTKAPFKQ